MSSARWAVRLGVAALALAATAEGQSVPRALVGTWTDVQPAAGETDTSATTVYREVAFTDTEMTWTFVAEFAATPGGWLLADRYSVAYRLDGDRVVTPGEAVTTVRVAGDTLTVTTQVRGRPTTVHTMARAPAPADLTGDWVADPSALPLGAALGAGYRLLPDGAVQALPGGQDVGGYVAAGPYALLYRPLPPEDVAIGLETSYTPAALGRDGDGDRLVITSADRPPIVLRKR